MSGLPDKFIPVKHVVADMRDRYGIVVSRQYVLAMIRASGVTRYGNNVRLSEIMDWWARNPGFAPRSRKRRVAA